MLSELIEKWHSAKLAEKAAQNDRLNIEKQIAELVDLPENGPTDIGDGMKINTGYTRKWDQEKLAELKTVADLPERLFPFKIEFKEDANKAKYIQQNEPQLWEYFLDALTLTPKKPAFTYKDPK